MKEAELAPLALLVDQLEPSDPVSRFSWLFNEYWPHMPQGEREERSFESVENARADAIRHLLRSGGMEALIRLADIAALPDHVAVAVGGILRTADEFIDLIGACVGSTNKLAIFSQVLSGRADLKFGKLWRDRMMLWHREGRWTSEHITNLLFGMKDERSTWDFVASFGDDIERLYWKRKVAWPLQGEMTDVEFAVEKYLSVGRATSAIQVLHYVLREFPAQTMFRILDAGIEENASEGTPTSHFVYELGEIFDELQRRADVRRVDIARREYAYLPLFRADRHFTRHQSSSARSSPPAICTPLRHCRRKIVPSRWASPAPRTSACRTFAWVSRRAQEKNCSPNTSFPGNMRWKQFWRWSGCTIKSARLY
jgi:hypothetical protein